MRTIFIGLTILSVGTTCVRADNYSDIAQFAQSICGDISEGSLTRTSIQGKVEANAGLLANIVSGDSNVSGTRAEDIYKGIPFDKLPDKIPTVGMCKLELVKVLLMPVAAEELEQSTSGWCSPIQSGNNNNVNCNGVDPRAEHRLNDLLDRMDADLKQKNEEAKLWARRYTELNAQLEETKKQLATKGEDTTLVQSVQDLLHNGKLEEAGTLLDESIKRQEAALNRTQTDLANSYASRAYAFRLLHQYGEAEKLYSKIFAIEEKALGFKNPELAAHLNNQGELFLGEGSFDKAEVALRHSIEIYDSLNPDDTQLIAPLSNLGQVYWATFRYAEAEALYEHAIAIGEKASLSSRSDLAITRRNYAQLLDKLGRTDEAAKQRALAAAPAP